MSCSKGRVEENQVQTDANLRSLYDKWRDNPTLENAAEVVDCAVQLDRPLLAIGPAKAIAEDSNAMPAVQAVAEFVLRGPKIPDLDRESPAVSREQVGFKIRVVKRRLADEPRNGLLWMEKGRLHTEIGDIRNAELSLRRALGCAPENRMILRAFARFMVHVNRPSEGHDRLRQTSIVKYDPWIQAAEIALADISGRSPISMKRGEASISEREFSPLQLSELASAIATFEAKSGTRRAKEYFRESLQHPTENALSQAYWVREALSLPITIKTSMLTIQGAFEARSRHCLEQKQWKEATANCEKWLRDEPFSIRAAAEGSFLASSLLWDPTKGLDFCERGLEHRAF
jgi:tetratricopeptide (TPR) repeat protein